MKHQWFLVQWTKEILNNSKNLKHDIKLRHEAKTLLNYLLILHNKDSHYHLEIGCVFYLELFLVIDRKASFYIIVFSNTPILSISKRIVSPFFNQPPVFSGLNSSIHPVPTVPEPM